MRTLDGRLVAPVMLPLDLAESLAAEARRTGRPVGRVAGDLVAAVLPDALAEAARGLLLPSDAQRPGELTPDRASEPSQNATTIVLGRGSQPAGGDDGDPAT